ncbi:Uncharacterised protein [Mycobacteroides abscessus subsp. massiliense]|nr:Uncharacterised protein [Mycobacteroides abscessus subsp. massiliense]
MPSDVVLADASSPLTRANCFFTRLISLPNIVSGVSSADRKSARLRRSSNCFMSFERSSSKKLRTQFPASERK